jgi:putative salt-induced outer membrane protein YdiY
MNKPSGHTIAVPLAVLLALIFNAKAYAVPGTWQQSEDTQQHDWVQLASGEWLKGKVMAMYDGQLDFRSVGLGKLTLKWADVAELRTAGNQSVRFKDGSTAQGELLINSETVSVAQQPSEPSVTAQPRQALVSIPAAERPPKDPWQRSMTFGLDVRNGNTDELDYVADIELKRETNGSRWLLDYTASYSETDNVETGNSQLLSSSFDWFVAEKVFLRVPDFEYFRDPFQNIDQRVTAGIAVGYQILDNPKSSWDVTAGPSYQHTVFEEVPQGSDDSESSAVFAMGTRYKRALTSTLDFDFRYNLKVVDESVGKMIHYLETGVSVDLMKNLDLDVTLYVDRIEEPREEANGEMPEKNDVRLSVGVSYDF